MTTFLATLLIDGSTAFIGSKISQSLGQKEISEMIAASGYAVIGISLLGPITWTVKKLMEIGEMFSTVFGGLKALVDAISKFIPGL